MKSNPDKIVLQNLLYLVLSETYQLRLWYRVRIWYRLIFYFYITFEICILPWDYYTLGFLIYICRLYNSLKNTTAIIGIKNIR